LLAHFEFRQISVDDIVGGDVETLAAERLQVRSVPQVAVHLHALRMVQDDVSDLVRQHEDPLFYGELLEELRVDDDLYSIGIGGVVGPPVATQNRFGFVDGQEIAQKHGEERLLNQCGRDRLNQFGRASGHFKTSLRAKDAIRRLTLPTLKPSESNPMILRIKDRKALTIPNIISGSRTSQI